MGPYGSICGFPSSVVQRLSRAMQPPLEVAHFEHLIAQNDLLPIPRAGRHSHFSVRLTLDHDRRVVARREFFENFFGRVCLALRVTTGVTCIGSSFASNRAGVSAYGAAVSAYGVRVIDYGFSHQ
jgi:hypothetical protein